MRIGPDPARRRAAVVAFGLAAIVLYAFWPVLGHDFITSFDDERYVTGNPHVQRGLTPASLGPRARPAGARSRPPP